MKRTSIVLLVIVLASLLALYGCPKKAEMASAPEPVKTEPAPAPVVAEPAPAETAKPGTEAAPQEKSAAGMAGLQAIYFDFDQSFIRSDAKPAMKANAEWLKANPTARVRIEGNCDERGTIEYNQALGQRRAAAAKKYLTDLGIKATRISLISYGKEKPVCTDSTEECWQKNRRGDLVAAE